MYGSPYVGVTAVEDGKAIAAVKAAVLLVALAARARAVDVVVLTVRAVHGHLRES